MPELKSICRAVLKTCSFKKLLICAWHSQLNPASTVYLPLGKKPTVLGTATQPIPEEEVKMSRDNVMLFVALIFSLWID